MKHPYDHGYLYSATERAVLKMANAIEMHFFLGRLEETDPAVQALKEFKSAKAERAILEIIDSVPTIHQVGAFNFQGLTEPGSANFQERTTERLREAARIFAEIRDIPKQD